MRLSSAIALIGVITFTPLLVYAQETDFLIEKISNVGENHDFIIRPGKAEIILNPGDKRTVDIEVTNRMHGKRTFLIGLEDIKGSRDTDQAVIFLGDDRGPYSLKEYLKIPVYEFSLEQGDRATIPVTVSAPTDAEPGGLYGSVIISTTSGGAETGSASSIVVSRIGVLFFVKVLGEVKESGKLKEFKTKTGEKFFSKNPVEFEILYENNGNVHLNPYGEIRVKNIFGREVDTILIDPWFALPDSLRLRELSWKKSPLLGFYTAEAFINRGYQDIVDHDQFGFFVLPWKFVTAVLIAILIFILATVLFIRKFRAVPSTNV